MHLSSGNAAIVCDNRNIDTSRTYNDYAALHGDTPRLAKAALSLTLKDARLLCSFVVVRDGGDGDGLQLLYDAVGVAATGIRGRAADNTATSIKVRVRPHAAETEEAPGATVEYTTGGFRSALLMRSSSGCTRGRDGGSGCRCCVGIGCPPSPTAF